MKRQNRLAPLVLLLSTMTEHSLRLAESHAAQLGKEVAIYHADPQHLSNRLHRALFIRVGSNGIIYGADRLEPLLWPASQHLLEEGSHERAIATLDEFISTNGQELIDDALKRAILQRDLWLVFNWLDGRHGDFAEPSIHVEQVQNGKERLGRRLATIIGQLALRPDEINGLSDNYSLAVASKKFLSHVDAQEPETPYLPPDLFLEDGPWVCVGRMDGLTAPQHLREDGTNRFTNSVFLVYLRLPGSRTATVEFLKQLRFFPGPLFLPAQQALRQTVAFMPNSELPQFPKGTELALVRRAMLIDSTLRIVVSPITESVQLRIIHGDSPAISKQVLSDALSVTPAARQRIREWQSFHEFRLSRESLFAKKAVGLRAVGQEERDFKTGFNAHPGDEFERRLRADQSFGNVNQRIAIIDLCYSCHGLPGVFSFNSLQDFRSGIVSDGQNRRVFPLSDSNTADVSADAVKWKTERPAWKSLLKLLQEESER